MIHSGKSPIRDSVSVGGSRNKLKSDNADSATGTLFDLSCFAEQQTQSDTSIARIVVGAISAKTRSYAISRSTRSYHGIAQ